MRGQPEQNTRPLSRLPSSMDAWMNSQLNYIYNVALILKLCKSLMCLSYFCHVTNGFLYNQALSDVRSTGAGIKCLYCMRVERHCQQCYQRPLGSCGAAVLTLTKIKRICFGFICIIYITCGQMAAQVCYSGVVVRQATMHWYSN